jgi:uncharacterized phage infection (PIP) family protein YhgE
VNRDLLQRVHAIEQQTILLSKTKDALQENVDKVQEEKSGLQLSLHQEEAQEADLKQRLLEKEGIIKELQNELEHAKKSSQILRDEITSRKEASQKEISELKEKVVSLEAQIMEKSSTNNELQQQLESSKKNLAKAEKLISKLKQSSLATPKSTPKVDDPLGQPVLLSDPAEQQMNPEVANGLQPPLKSESPSDDKNTAAELGIGDGQETKDGSGVLPIPGAGGENLDAAEDDGDHPLKEDGVDQSPDGTLSAKEIKDSGLGVGPAPPPGKAEGGLPDVVQGHGGQSGQDVREAAHLSDMSRNTL